MTGCDYGRKNVLSILSLEHAVSSPKWAGLH